MYYIISMQLKKLITAIVNRSTNNQNPTNFGKIVNAYDIWLKTVSNMQMFCNNLINIASLR